MKKLGFGFMRLPQKDNEIDLQEVCKMADKFLERGFTYFDTAYMYHDGKSEIAFREAVVKRHPRDSFTIADKMPTMSISKVEDLERIFNEQLEKCGVDYFDYYLLHCLTTNNNKVSEKLAAYGLVRKMKAEGKLRKAGFSFHDSAKVLDEIMTNHPEMDFVQLQINYLDWDDNNVQSGECYKVARKHGKDIIVMEPVKGGTLANVPESAEKLFKSARPDSSAASWAVRFAAGLDGVMMVLSGMSNMEQLLDNTDYMMDFEPLNENEQKLITRAVQFIRSPDTIPCTACLYCIKGCPQNIAIPDYFALYNKKIASKADVSAEFAKLAGAHGKPSDCIGCAQCKEACPQHINIIEQLARAARVIE